MSAPRLTAPTLTPEQAAQLDTLAPTLGAWLANPELLRPPTPLMSHLAWRGRITLYSAPDKGGKSTFCTAGVAAASRGAPFLGEGGGARVRVAWICLEEAQGDLIARLRDFGADMDNVRVLAFPKDTRADVALLVRLWRPDVVILDTLIRYASGHVTKAGESAQWSVIMGEFITLARRDEAALVLLHHARGKDGAARDSTEIPAACDVVVEQRKRHTAQGVQRFTVRARFAVRDFAVRFVGRTYALLQESTAIADTPDELASARACLTALSEQRCTATEWERLSGVSHATFYRHLETLHDGGYVAKQRRTYAITDTGRAVLGLVSVSQQSQTSLVRLDQKSQSRLTPHVNGGERLETVRSKRETGQRPNRTRRSTKRGVAGGGA